MEKFSNFMEEHFVPLATKISSQKHLVAVRDAFIAIMPVTMAGAIATLLNVFVRDLPTTYIPDAGIAEMFAWLIGINGLVWWGTLAVISLVFIFALGYQVSKVYGVNELAGGLIATSAFITITPQVVGETWGGLSWAYLNANGLFTALIVGLVTSIIYAKLMIANVTIKMPDSVPPAVSNAFASIIPGTIAIYVAGLAGYLVSTFMGGQAIGDLVATYIQTPFLNLSQGIGAVLIVVIAVQLFWFFGIHGTNVLGALLDGTYLSATLANEAAASAGEVMQYVWVRGSFDAYVWMGGAGCTIALIIAIFIFSKRADSRAVATMSAPMGVFNINEPVVFGMPIVLNPIYFIPWMLVPIVLTIIAYAATAAGLVPFVHVVVPWVIPPVLYAFLATGGSFAAALLAAVNLVIAVVIWGAFVLVANKMDNE
ncbi:PTS sugar transporter subunit IIC [Tannockella kyphosi]|uniref:PTS sugar transporter subunit IIC n=1 Tax=Tannockella kyphosi TaxID=2899121 RepID=UPI0020115FFE|nr:PTS transporter subunit EIIC [Tannockella kyphosi]